MHEMQLDRGDTETPRAWHITEPGHDTALCGTRITPIRSAEGTEARDLHCADCLLAYNDLVTAPPTPEAAH